MRRLLFATAAVVLLLNASSAEAAWRWPVSGEVITPYRNGADPYAAGQHRGIDIAAAVGTPVVAATAGEVRFAGSAGSSGVTVSMRTADGFDSSYLHLSSLAVRAGERVSGGERLGAVGTTGERSAAAPHLHFGVREAGTRYAYLDPLSLLPPLTAPPPSEAPQPSPAPAPAPLAPSPAPRPAPAPGGAARPAPVPRRAPRPAPVPGRAPRPAPAPGGLPGPTRVPAHGPRPFAAPVPRGTPQAAPAPGGARRSAPTPGRTPHAVPAPAASLDRSMLRPTSPAAPSAPAGPDVGWALACGGLLLAAAILGLTDDGRKATARSRSRLTGALRPLLGGR